MLSVSSVFECAFCLSIACQLAVLASNAVFERSLACGIRVREERKAGRATLETDKISTGADVETLWKGANFGGCTLNVFYSISACLF
jgi:hypothetical protein